VGGCTPCLIAAAATHAVTPPLDVQGLCHRRMRPSLYLLLLVLALLPGADRTVAAAPDRVFVLTRTA